MKDDSSLIQVELLEELLQHFETGVPQLHFFFECVCCKVLRLGFDRQMVQGLVMEGVFFTICQVYDVDFAS